MALPRVFTRQLGGKAIKPNTYSPSPEPPSMASLDDHLKEDILSDSYLDAFYKAHVAAGRGGGRGSLDEDIAAIEAEIRK